jgi:FMN phosphatase YigB (HAD superfamily)
VLNLPRPSIIVFDLDNTLYDYDQPNTFATQTLIEKISSQASIETLEVKSALEASRVNVKQRLGETASSHSRLLYIAEVYRLLNLSPFVEQFLILEKLFWDSYLSQMQQFPGVNQFIQLLKKQDIPLALVTDLTSNIQYQKLMKLELDSCFDFILTSEEAGGDKSSGLPFELLSKICSAPLANTWFIGDGEFDQPAIPIEGAIFFRKGVRTATSGQVSQYVFENFDELKGYVFSLRPETETRGTVQR